MTRDAGGRPRAPTPDGRNDRAPARGLVASSAVIRPFEPRDAAAARALFITVNRLLAPLDLADRFEAYVAAALREEIDDIPGYYSRHGGRFFVAEAEGRLAGMFGLEDAGAGAAELRRMYVDPRFRGRGLGRRLLASAEIEAGAGGFETLVLSTSEIQTAALRLYRDAGYREVRQNVATRASHKTVCASIRRFHFEKRLRSKL